MALRDAIEARFERWGHVSARHRHPIIFVTLALSVLLGASLPELRADTSTRSFLHRNDPARIEYDAFLEQFGSDQLILVMLQPERIFDPAFLDKLRGIHEAIRDEAPFVHDVTSLINVRETRGVDDELIVRGLLDDPPHSGAALDAIQRRARESPTYRNFVLSADGRTTAIVVELQTSVDDEGDELGGFEDAEPTQVAEPPILRLDSEQERAAVDAIVTIVDAAREPGLVVHVTGGPVTTAQLTDQMSEDMALFLVVSLVAVGVFLFALFRRLSAVLLPLGVVLLSVMSTFGVMAAVDRPLGIPTQILPSFLLAVGIGGTVHLLTIFFRRYDAGESCEEALAGALHHSGLAIVMTGLTTAGGLVSFVVAEIQPVADLGIFAPIGIGLGLIYCMVLLPAVLHCLPLKRLPAREPGRPDWIERVLTAIGDRCVHRPRTVLACMSGVLVVALIGTTRLDFSYDPVGWFPPEHPLRAATDFANDELGGAVSLELVIDSGQENGLHEPAFLRELEALQTGIDGMQGSGGVRIGKSASIVDVSQEIHSALHENRPELRVIPDDRQLVAQELLLFENSGSDDLEDVTDPMFRHARMTLKLPYSPPTHYRPFIARIDELAQERFGANGEVTTTGFVRLMTRSLDAISISLRKSYLIALAIITPLMFLLLGTLRTGIAAMVPNLAPIALTLGMMGWLGLPLDTFTLMIGSIAIGLAVDDTIHFMHGFRRFHDACQDTPLAVRQTLHTTGHALLVTSLVLSLAFFVYGFASLANLARFGLITGTTILTAFVADVTLSPALMALSTRGDRLAAARHAQLRRLWARGCRRLAEAMR